MRDQLADPGEVAPEIETERLLLRPWADEDREPFAALNADPEVMRYFPSVLDRQESDAMIESARQRTREDGICFQPVVVKESGTFIGFVGLSRPRYPVPFAPCVEVGWRLARSAWGYGYASEAASAWLRFGFEILGLEEIVSFTTVTNTPSRRVMERLGMQRDAEGDFDHPLLDRAHPLLRHVLYRLRADRWRELSGSA
ncbi:GNAT family N-acetyltransferase [Stappia sp. WLB 29]|uniref:GNAT family N-acetyltransferase n=1 Tax=Stappia sp. WLB 29 TaxID=2925220 RepID=UPI0020BE75BC|nr:GNAT family N-acetyltransferase [Stappia sp. WLB 29]